MSGHSINLLSLQGGMLYGKNAEARTQSKIYI